MKHAVDIIMFLQILTKREKNGCIHQSHPDAWWEKSDLQSEKRVMTMTLTEINGKQDATAYPSCNHQNHLHLRWQVFIMFLNVFCNLGSTQLWGEVSLIPNSFINRQSVMTSSAWRYMHRILLTTNIQFIPHHYGLLLCLHFLNPLR